MAATVKVIEFNGFPGVQKDILAGRYCTADTPEPGTNNPCVVPTSDFNYSYWKHHALQLSGHFTKIDKIRWYTSGAIAHDWTLGDGGMLQVGVRKSGDSGCPLEAYKQAVGIEGTTGTPMEDTQNGHPYYNNTADAELRNADLCTSANPLLIDSTLYANPETSKSLGRNEDEKTFITKFVVTQIKIFTNATQGDKGAQTLTWRYDEI